MNLLGPLDVMTLPPRIAGRALDDLHNVADGVQRLASRDGDLSVLLQSVRALPRVEDKLSARIDELRLEVRGLKDWLEPLHRELTDLDEAAEGPRGGAGPPAARGRAPARPGRRLAHHRRRLPPGAG